MMVCYLTIDIILPRFYRNLKRGPQVILPKDIGTIISYSNISKNSVCIDAGTGSGWLAVSLAKICKEVYSYEIRPDFIKIAEKNKIKTNVDNLTIKNQDVLKGIKEKNVDLVTLDMPNSDRVIRYAYKALAEKGIVMGYCPHIEQAKKFVKKLERYKFKDIYTLETIIRDILIRDRGTRPSTKGIWHTAYLTFGEKV